MLNSLQSINVVACGRYMLLGLLSTFLLACGSAPSKDNSSATPAKTESSYAYVDSTEYIAEDTGSVSMRASFTKGQASEMSEGYKFQFRTINQTPVFLSSISIVAGGKRFFLEEGQIVLSNQQALTLQFPLAESKLIAQYPSALLQFRYNNESQLLLIELHQLKPFEPRAN